MMTEHLPDWNTFRSQVKLDPNVLQVIHGISKEDIKEKFGLQYNDINNDIWMFRLTKRHHFFKRNYLYIRFKNNVIVNTELKSCKRQRFICV